MANIFIEAPQDKVFEAMCDLPATQNGRPTTSG